MAEVILKNISKIYDDTDKERGRKKAVDDISFTVLDKEFMVLVGPSGCGKSTLLRMIAGLEDISEGTLAIDGKRINDLTPRDRDIAMVFQNYALYPHMTVYDNMAFGLKLKNFSKADIKERVMQTAQLLEIEDELYRKPKTLSGGQRQRVAIGRAIIRRPKVFLFDELLLLSEHRRKELALLNSSNTFEDEPRRGQGDDRVARRQGRGLGLEEDRLGRRRRRSRIQARQGHGAGHSDRRRIRPARPARSGLRIALLSPWRGR